MYCDRRGVDEDDENEKERISRGRVLAMRFLYADNYLKMLELEKEGEQKEKAKQKKSLNGFSVLGLTSGIYGVKDVLYNSKTEEYLFVNKVGDVMRYDAILSKVGVVTPSKKFSKFIYIPQTGHYLCYNPGKIFFYVYREDWTVAIDTVCISTIDNIFYGGKVNQDGALEFYIVSGAALNKYIYNPTTNAISLQEVIKVSDIEAENGQIELVAFDQPEEDEKQWIYMTYKHHATVIDVAGRSHGTKKHLHKHKITAIAVYGPSEFVVTGDDKGTLKMWAQRWQIITEIEAGTAAVTHLIEHLLGRAIISFLADQTIFVWNLDSKERVDALMAPEIVERIAVNPEKKEFVTSGPRKIALWSMEELPPPGPATFTGGASHLRREIPKEQRKLKPVQVYPPKGTYATIEEDVMSIVEGNHNFSIRLPDLRKMTKKQLDDYGKTVFPDEWDKRKMFVSESRVETMHQMARHGKDIEKQIDRV